jgi:hypothetical protein
LIVQIQIFFVPGSVEPVLLYMFSFGSNVSSSIFCLFLFSYFFMRLSFWMCAFTKKVPISHGVGCICAFIQLMWCNTFGLVDWWWVKQTGFVYSKFHILYIEFFSLIKWDVFIPKIHPYSIFCCLMPWFNVSIAW